MKITEKVKEEVLQEILGDGFFLECAETGRLIAYEPVDSPKGNWEVVESGQISGKKYKTLMAALQAAADEKY